MKRIVYTRGDDVQLDKLIDGVEAKKAKLLAKMRKLERDFRRQSTEVLHASEADKEDFWAKAKKILVASGRVSSKDYADGVCCVEDDGTISWSKAADAPDQLKSLMQGLRKALSAEDALLAPGSGMIRPKPEA